MRFQVPTAVAALVLMAGTAQAFDACPTAGSAATTAAPDGKSYTTIFDNFAVEAGKIGTCSFSFGLSNGAAPGTISVFSADYRGFVSLANADTASVSIEHNGESDGEAFNGPVDVDYTHSNVVATTDGKVVSKGTVDMSDATDPDNDVGTLDGADYTEIGRITLPTDETTIITHLGPSTSLLLSGQPISEENSVTLLGGIGSAMLGAGGQFNLGQGFSLLGSASYVTQSYSTVGVQGIVGGLAVRYVQPDAAAFRPFAEGGVSLGGLGLTFTDPAKTTTSAGLASLYATGGAETALNANTTLTGSATLEESFLGVSGYSLSSGPFSATIPAQTGRFSVVKGTIALRSQISETVDITASGSAGMLLAHDKVKATIGGLGAVGQTPPSQIFVDYGVKVGLDISPRSRFESFIQGSTTADLGTHAQIGAAFTQKF